MSEDLPGTLIPEAPVDVAPPKLSASDRLRTVRIKTEVVNVGTDADPIMVEVRGLESGQAMDLGESQSEGATAREATPALLRSTCWDVETQEPLYETWSDEELMRQPIDVVNRLVMASNRVMGRTSEPGKG